MLIVQAQELVATSSSPAFDRYASIINRKPFGSETPPVSAAGGPGGAASLAEAAANSLKMSAIIQDSRGRTEVGLLDTTNSKSYMMRVGDIEEGIELLSADYENERAKIRRDGVERWLSMSGENMPVDAMPGSSSINTAFAKAVPPRRYVKPAKGGLTKAEYAKIKDQRPPPRSPRRALLGLPDEPPMTAEERDQDMQEYNMELIRAGGELGPALPIELTPEQDAQLVKEGVLPPQE